MDLPFWKEKYVSGARIVYVKKVFDHTNDHIRMHAFEEVYTGSMYIVTLCRLMQC